MTLIALGIVLSYVIASTFGFVFAIFDKKMPPTPAAAAFTLAAFLVVAGTIASMITLLVTLVVLIAAGDAAWGQVIVLTTATIASIACSIWVSTRL